MEKIKNAKALAKSVDRDGKKVDETDPTMLAWGRKEIAKHKKKTTYATD